MSSHEIHLGFTGTRHGMSPEQHAAVARLVVEVSGDAFGPIVAHHGDCVGADAQFHAIARGVGARVVGHPPTDEKLRAFCSCDENRPAAPYLARNHDIVSCSSRVIAAPYEIVRPKRFGGTWATAVRAYERRCPLDIVYRDGRVQHVPVKP